MKRSKKYIIFFFLLVGLLVNCDKNSLGPTLSKDPDFSSTPMENEEAELAALHLSGKLIAPLPLYEQIKEELELIRETWSDSIVHVNLTFDPYLRESNIKTYVSQATYDSMNAGLYHHWDSLNDHYRIDTIALGRSIYSSYRWANLYFEGRLNPLLLVDIYAGLPGFISLTSVASWPIGDRPILLLLQEEQTIKYFFRYAYGDCPSGCIHSEIYYFTVEQNSALYHGSYFSYPADSIRPTWFDTVLIAFDKYSAWNQWPD